MTACALVPCRFEWTDSLSWQYNFSKKEFLKFHFREKELCHHLCRRQRQRGHLLLKIYTKFIPMFTDPIYQLQMSIIHQKKSETSDFHHIEGYQNPPTWAREKGGVKMSK